MMTISLSRPGRESDSEAEDIAHAEKLLQVKAVLEEVIFFHFKLFTYSHFSYVSHKCNASTVDLVVMH